MKASIIIPINNNYEIFSNFVNQINTNKTFLNYEIILAIDGYIEDRIKLLINSIKQNNNNIKVVVSNLNIGYSRINNKAVKIATEEILIFMNMDIFVIDNCLDILIKCINDGIADIVQPKLIYPQTNRIQSTGHIFGDCYNQHAFKNRKINDSCVNKSSYRQAVTTALCAMKKSIFNKLNGFNEYYYNGWEGLELTLSATINGYKCWYESSASAYHIQGASRGNLEIGDMQQGCKFWSKWNNHVKFDVTQIIKTQLNDKYCQIIKSNNFLVYDFTANQSWNRILNDIGIKNYTIIKKPKFRGQNNIDLFCQLSRESLISDYSFIIAVDNYIILKNNCLWIKYRTLKNKNDLFIDLSGNIGLLKDIKNQ